MLLAWARASKRPRLVLTVEEKQYVDQLSQSRTAAVRDVQRAQILGRYEAGETVSEISRALRMTRKSVLKWIDKALQMGVKTGIRDTPHEPREAVISDDAKAWVVHLACSKPKDLGYAGGSYGRGQCWPGTYASGRLQPASRRWRRQAKPPFNAFWLHRQIQPHKIRYYLERRDPDFERKMREVLLVYQEVALRNETAGAGDGRAVVITVSVDEKPGVQAITNTAPDLPVAGKHPTIARDHEYVRHGTWSILAALDLHDGHVTARVEQRHRSVEFIAWLKDLDVYYPSDCTIRLVLDNHSAHISRETRAYLATRPNRFKYVLTPTHGSWLNLAETLFGKMARTFLRHIRVQSKEELRQRMLRGIDEINEMPIVHRWKAFDPSPQRILFNEALY
jgi:transposase